MKKKRKKAIVPNVRENDGKRVGVALANAIGPNVRKNSEKDTPDSQGDLFSVVDPETCTHLRDVLASGEVRLKPQPYTEKPLDDAERARLAASVEHLRISSAHHCGDAECRTYTFATTGKAGLGLGRVLQFDVTGLAVVFINSGGEIYEYERLLWTSDAEKANVLRSRSRAARPNAL